MNTDYYTSKEYYRWLKQEDETIFDTIDPYHPKHLSTCGSGRKQHNTARRFNRHR